MHPIEGADYQTVSGDRRFKDTDPATEFRATEANQLLLSLHRLVTESGQTLLANNAADLADNWMQIVRSVYRLAHKEAYTDYEVSDGNGPYDLPGDVHFVRLIPPEGGDEPNAPFELMITEAMIGRRVLIQNDSSTNKRILTGAEGGGNYPEYIELAPRQILEFKAIDNDESALWVPVSSLGVVFKEIFACKLYREGGYLDGSNSFDLDIRVDKNMDTTLVQNMNGTGTGVNISMTLTDDAEGIFLATADGDTLPNYLVGKPNSDSFEHLLCYVYVSGTINEFVGLYTDGGSMTMRRLNGTDFPDAATLAFAIPNFTMINKTGPATYS